MDSVARLLNALPEEGARAALARCCGSSLWVQRMMTARPYAVDQALFDVAEGTWWELRAEDWLEAFSHHPRIGERIPDGPAVTEELSWAVSEQAGMDRAGGDVHEALVAGNIEYEERFGHVFLICATGRSGEEMLAALRSRLGNDPEDELRVAAGEQARITRLRLEKLVDT